MTFYYEQAKKLDELKKNPSKENLGILLGIIQGDEPLACYFYEQNEEAGWITYLDEAKEFEELGTDSQNIPNSLWLKAKYLTRISKEKPNEVLKILKRFKPVNEFIKYCFAEAVVNMPEKFLKEGFEITKGLISERKGYEWHWVGEATAKLMVKLSEREQKLSFELARLLFDIWNPSDEEKRSLFEYERSRFGSPDYEELLKKYYIKISEKYPYKALKLLVEILDEYLIEQKKKNERDRSEDYYIYIEDIEEGNKRGFNHIDTLIVEGIRDSIKMLIEKEPGKIEEARKLLEDKGKVIFTRLEMYLLGKIEGKKYKDRINKILKERRYFETGYSKEYNRLLCVQKDIIEDDVKEQILRWIEEIKVDDKEDFKKRLKEQFGENSTDEDVIKYESRWRAQRLYSIQEVFPQEFKKYSNQSGATEEALKPETIVSEAQYIPGDLGTPLTNEQMNKMKVEEVLEYLRNPKNYNYVPKGYQPNSPKEALEYTFQMNVKERVADYLNIEPKIIVSLDKDFLSRYFNGIWDALREKKTESFEWDKYFVLAKEVVNKFPIKTENTREVEPLVRIIQEGFKEEYKLKYSKERLDTIYEIIRPLFEIKENLEEDSGRDPVQLRYNSTTGEALMTVLSIGIICKRDFNEKYNSGFENKIIEIFEKVLNEIKTSWTICIFGSDFARIYWLVPDWIKNNLNQILSDENWQTVWGIYLHWSRPSKELFTFLNKNGIYKKAIEEKEKLTPLDKEHKPERELSSHIVIPYFNGWLDGYDDKLLQIFIKNSDDELMAYTADFFTTGFESLQKEQDSKTNERIKIYWEKRIGEISKDKEGHQKEISSLANWIDKCPLDKKTALDLEEKTLRLCHTKFGKNRDYYETINALCSYEDVDVLRVVKCIRMVIKVNETSQYFSFFEEKLTRLLENIQKDKKEKKELLEETIQLVDELGRLHIYNYRPIYEKLSVMLKDVTRA
jgi:hypothetical protein